MTGLWSLRPRSLCAGFWAGERVMVSVIRLLRRGARYGDRKPPRHTRSSHHQIHDPYQA
ncbi:Putative protein without homology [Lacticaseibacillus rhamnosus GG]|nr:Putative protein without homology [Lacticaseibacillus rhamnosus GG]